MHIVLIVACFVAAAVVTVRRGAGIAFAYVYLPAVLFFSTTKVLRLTGIPDATAPTAAVYGILMAGAFIRWPPFRPAVCDAIFLLLLGSYVTTAITTSIDVASAAIAVFGSTVLQLIAPYFVARSWLGDRNVQRAVLNVLVVSSFVIGFFAVVEARLWPNFYEQLLLPLGLVDRQPGYAHQRFGFFRARSSFVHPIDLGISGALVMGLIFVLARRTGIGVRNAWIRASMACCAVASVCGISFSSIVGLAFGVGAYLGLASLRFARRLIPLGVAVGVAAALAYSVTLATAPLPEDWEVESAFQGSHRTRQLILQLGWPAATTAGPFGLGTTFDTLSLGLESVDNAYLLITIQRGWVALALWLLLPIALAVLASRALRASRSEVESRAILGGLASVVGTMVAMYTVWFGFVYPSLFVIAVALTVSASQSALRAARIAAAARRRPPAADPAAVAEVR